MEKISYSIEIKDNVVDYNNSIALEYLEKFDNTTYAMELEIAFINALLQLEVNPKLYPRYRFLDNDTIRYFIIMKRHLFVYKIDDINSKIIVYYAYNSYQDSKVLKKEY
jgi:hypothetical protein